MEVQYRIAYKSHGAERFLIRETKDGAESLAAALRNLKHISEVVVTEEDRS